MGKTKRNGRELDICDKLKYENKKLKREIKQLRKLLDRIDYQHLTDAVEHYEDTGEKYKITSNKEKEKKRWECYKCQEGYLELVIVGNWYWRKCTNCDRKTKRQEYANNIKGIFKGKIL